MVSRRSHKPKIKGSNPFSATIYQQRSNVMVQLQESSLSRVWDQISKFDYGTITGFRSARDCNQGEKYSKKENLQRNKSVVTKLQAKGYSVTKIAGAYIEDYGSENAKEVKENSFLVVDIKQSGMLESDLRKIGAEFEQDSILFGKAGKPAELIGTNKCESGYPGWNKRVAVGKGIFGRKGEFFSKVGDRPFVFKESAEASLKFFEIASPKLPSDFRSVLMSSRSDWKDLYIGEDENEPNIFE